MLFFNIENGYLDGIVRGYKSGLLTSSQYHNLTHCETLEDLKLQLSTTEYGSFLRNESGNMNTSLLSEKCTELYVEQFNHLKECASEPLVNFIDYITYGYMIDNVILLITGALHNRNVEELISKCHPLGLFEGMEALTTASTPEELYNTVIVETPLAKYFSSCISARDLDEINIEIIRNTLYKKYLDDFFLHCQNIGGETFGLMSEILMFEADKRIINIVLDSFGTELTPEGKLKLFPDFSNFFPEDMERLSTAEGVEQVTNILSQYPCYKNIASPDVDDKDLSMDQKLFEREVYLNKNSFQTQFHYACFYSFTKLKEHEIRNIIWISECISQRQRDKIGCFVHIF